jgi:hypothetical protein
MKLTELEPRWLSHDGNPHAVLAFRCPCCRAMWLTCTLVRLKTSVQFAILRAQLPGNGGQVVPCNQSTAWKAEGVPDFDALTIAPSLDASAAGHWHGWIRAGAIA